MKKNKAASKAEYAYVADRDRGRCRWCFQAGGEIHHIVYRSQGGPDDRTNLITLCKICHMNAHAGKIDRRDLLWMVYTGRKLYGSNKLCITCNFASIPLEQLKDFNIYCLTYDVPMKFDAHCHEWTPIVNIKRISRQ